MSRSFSDNNVNVNLVTYPKQTCLQVQKELSNLLNKSSINTNCHDFQKPLQVCNPTIIIFPILGDNRIPEQVEEWISSSTIQDSTPFYICITGDFDENPLSQVIVRDEAVRLLQQAGAKVAYVPLMIDTPIELTKELYRLVWLEKVASSIASRHSLTFSINNWRENSSTQALKVKTMLTQSKAWEDLLAILGQIPLLTYASKENNQEIKLSLIDSSPYPRSLLLNLGSDVLKQVFIYINQLPFVTSLDLSFANLSEWPIQTPDLILNLTALNIRGNAFNSYSFLSGFKKLQKLNMAANNLQELPKEVYGLTFLRKLFAYKNSINKIEGSISNLKELRRLTLYRNLLTGVPPEIGQCINLEVLNLGGNPIQCLPSELKNLPHLEELVLRNCHLQTTPMVIEGMKLRTLDLSKNIGL